MGGKISGLLMLRKYINWNKKPQKQKIIQCADARKALITAVCAKCWDGL